MTTLRVLWARLAQVRRILWAGLILAAAIAVFFLVRKARRRNGLPPAELPGAAVIAAAEGRIAEANARAAVEIAAARGKSAETHAELREVLADPDGKSRRQRLVELARRTSGVVPLLLVFLLAALVACATSSPPPPIVLPAPLSPAVDIDRLVPPPPTDDPLPPSSARHAPTAVERGDCAKQPGILVDEATFSQSIRNAAERERLGREVLALRQLHTTERREAEEIERVYRAQIGELQRIVLQPPSLWERWRFQLGFAAGVLVTGAGFYAGVRAAR